MKKVAIVVVSIVAAITIIGIIAGVAVTNQDLEQSDYKRTLQESVSSKSESQFPSWNGTDFVREIGETIEGSNTPRP